MRIPLQAQEEKLHQGFIPPFKNPDVPLVAKTLGIGRRFHSPFVSNKLPHPDTIIPLCTFSPVPDENCAPVEIQPVSKTPRFVPVIPQQLPPPQPEAQPAKIYKVYYARKYAGKNKHYEDGFLRCGAQVQLLASTGVVITSRLRPSDFSEEPGVSNHIGVYNVEVVAEVPREDFDSGRCFIAIQASKATTLLPTHAAPPVDLIPPDVMVLDIENKVFVPSFLASVLRPHQKQGVQFMFECISGKRGGNVTGCILADSMGLGKTLQTITLIYTLVRKDHQMLRKVIIASPKTLIENWKAEFLKWVGSTRLPPLTCLGSKKDKDRALKLFTSGPLPVLVISYETLRRHAVELSSCCDLLICDEGHRLKNSSIDTTKSLGQVSPNRRILLTGTPLQNNLKEFFACMSFSNPTLIDSWEKFNNVFAQPIVRAQDSAASAEQRELGLKRNQQLQELTTTFILRRTGEVLESLLPPRHEYLVFIRLAPLQESLYVRFLQTYQEALLGAFSGALSLLALLRKLVNHPYLLHSSKKLSAELRTIDEMRKVSLNGASSCKFAFIEALLRESAAVRDKVLIVSSFTSTLQALERFCSDLGLASLRLDGETSDKQRMELVKRFNSSAAEQVFLLSTKAGGCGLNLVGANRMVLFDADWNPSSDKQAMGRVWRDGQRKTVFIYRLFCSGTLEEKVHQLQANKEGLFARVVDSKQVMSHFSKEHLKEIFAYSYHCQTYAESDNLENEAFAGSFLPQLSSLFEVVKEQRDDWKVKEEPLDFSTAVEDDDLKRPMEDEDEVVEKRVKQ